MIPGGVARGRQTAPIARAGFDPALDPVLELLRRHALLGDTASRLLVEQAADLIRARLSHGGPVDGGRRRGLADWQVKRVTAYMQAHLDQVVRLEELAGLLGLSRFHFCTAFRVATGRTPHSWLRNARLARARQLLSDPGLSITDIALSVGYQTPSAFSAAFRRRQGLTPSEFRRASNGVERGPRSRPSLGRWRRSATSGGTEAGRGRTWS